MLYCYCELYYLSLEIHLLRGIFEFPFYRQGNRNSETSQNTWQSQGSNVELLTLTSALLLVHQCDSKTTLICIRNTEFMFNLVIINDLNSPRSLINIMPVKNELNCYRFYRFLCLSTEQNLFFEGIYFLFVSFYVRKNECFLHPMN